MTERHLHLVHVGPTFAPPAMPDTWPDAGDRAVSWGPWEPPRLMFICPPPKEPYRCGGCGSDEPCSTAVGKILPRPDDTIEVDEVVKSRRRPGRSYERTRRRPAHTYIGLFASRCPVCGHTEVYDRHTDTMHVPPWDDPSEIEE